MGRNLANTCGAKYHMSVRTERIDRADETERTDGTDRTGRKNMIHI